MDITQRELDLFAQEIENLGYSIREEHISVYGFAEVLITNMRQDPSFHRDVQSVASGLAGDGVIRDYNIIYYTFDEISIELH